MHRWVRVIHRALAAAMRDDVPDWAAALAFYFLFAFFPAVLLAATLLSGLRLAAWHGSLVDVIARNFPAPARDLVQQQLAWLVRGQGGGLMSFSTAVLAYSASQAVTGLMAALNAAYELPERRSFWRRLGLAWLLTLSAGLLTVLALAAIVFGQRLLEWWVSPLPILWPWIRWTTTVAFMALALTLVYRFAPSPPGAGRGNFLAVLVALALWLPASALLAVYVDRFAAYTAIYGSLGSVVVLLLWFYVLGLALLLGAEFQHAWAQQQG